MSNYKFTILALAAVITVFSITQVTSARQGAVATSAATTSDTGTVGMAFFVNGAPMQSCASTLDALPSSSTYKESDWEMSFRTDYNSTNGVSLPREQMIDLNGDGLVDYQYVAVSSADGYYNYSSCVYLNTGSGFEVVHRCYATLTQSSGAITSQTYKGDCAG